jgi:Fic family protein
MTPSQLFDKGSNQIAKVTPRGRFEEIGEGVQAFVPNALPRRISLEPEAVYEMDEASRLVAMLAGVGETLPNPQLLMTPFLRREAVLSSKIEGTVTSVSDLLLYEILTPSEPSSDAAEVLAYVRALEHGLRRMVDLPLSVRLMNEMHGILLESVRGADRRPGELRTRQVHVGAPGSSIRDALFVPPPAELVRDLLWDLEGFLNEDLVMPPLVQCALMHHQFETIHPYLDGNGRLGRLLITLLLSAREVMPTPLLYLSAFFERRRNDYYDQLQGVREHGDWAPWLRFFFEGVREQAKDALTRSRRLRELQARYRSMPLGDRASANALRLVDAIFANPFVTVPRASKLLEISAPGARNLLDRLVKAGVLERHAAGRPQVYVARQVLHAIEAPTAEEIPPVQ